eukprot:TRINITY_DN2032_c1_g1_i4.p1 TRINITY_DN2032_c1_g1~~TRINITY_DN2032_c1_g1_i4.p1  ORF type:complete len:1263 (-),score=561.83 TRINITY_DN2032_c1_g1_i4:48-3836(-)
MRNLIPISSQSNGQLSNENQEIVSFCRDSEGNNLFFVTSAGELIGLYEKEGKNERNVETVHLIKSGLIQSDSKIISIEFIPDLESVCIAANTGEIVLYGVESKEAECVGVIDSGLKSMNWSPDYEVVAFITGNFTILLMTKDWDVLVENPIIPLHLSSSLPSISSNSNPRVSWRGDGQFFAVNSLDVADKRTIRIYDRSCTFSSSSEALSGVEDVLYWKPSGQLIASFQNTAQKQQIIFYERNGLRHGEFSLREKSVVESIKWNADSDVLAILLSVEGRKGNVLQLWSSSNYHWYLKQEVTVPGEKIVDFSWDQELPLLLRLVTQNGNYVEKSFLWEYSVKEVLNENNSSISGVFDGNQINFTPFRFVVVPPPMSDSTIKFPHNVQEISFGGEDLSVVLLSDGSLCFISSPSTRDPPQLLGELQNTKKWNQVRQITLCGNRIIAIHPNNSYSDSILDISFTRNSEGNSFESTETFITDAKKRILRIHYDANTLKTFVETSEGRVFQYCREDQESIAEFKAVTLGNNSTFPTPCVKFATAVMAGKESFVGLDSRGKLYVDTQLISAECTTFAFHNKFLLFTTASNVLKFLLLEQPIPANISELKSTNLNSREVERGSRIVTVVPNDFKVILQMPRGNLEAIYPTILIIDTLKSMIDKLEFQKAFVLMRRHRIDVNFIYDYKPQLFLENLREFVNQISNPDHFNLFLSGLKSVDVTTTLYPDPINPKSYTTDDKKVNLLCDRLREELQAVDSEKFLKSILTTFVKREPPQLEEVLEVLRTLREKENEIDVTLPSSSNSKRITAEEALKYVCWLSDVDRLYDIALGTYDFDLVMMVAQKSQKDPKEYLPYLSSLKRMEKWIQRYTIDLSLGRYEKALFNLSKAGEEHFETCLQLVKDRNLYESAIQVYAEEKEHLYAVSEAYGDYLSSQTYYPEAALVYQSCEKDAKALNAFKSAGDWKMTMTMASKLSKSKEEQSNLAYEIAESFRSVSRFGEAAQLFFDYCQDIDQGINCLIEGNEWQEAMRRCHFHNRTELIQTSLQMSVIESFETNRALLEKWNGKWVKKSERLKIVQTNKLLMPMLDKSGVPISEDARSMMSGMSSYSAASAFSGVSGVSRASSTSGISIVSGSSLLSRGSRRGKPKQQRRRVTGKEGGPHEEEFLIEYLKRILPTAKFQEDIGNLIKMLLLFNHRSKAADIQSMFQKYLELIKKDLTILIPVVLPIPLDDNGIPLTEEQQKKKKADNLTKEASKLVPKVDWRLKMFENA